jgi:GTPase SAR1 family protein
LIVGEGGAGKTSLVKKIENETYKLQPDEKSTQGIDVIQWKFPLSFRFWILDFGVTLRQAQGGDAQSNDFGLTPP